MKNFKYLVTTFIACMMLVDLQAQTVLPYTPLKDDFGGRQIVDFSAFIPTIGDYTLEVKGKAGIPVEIAFSGIDYTPTENGLVRFVQKEGVIYVFESGTFKTSVVPGPQYITDNNNLILNPGFEIATEELTEGRWIPQSWETWDGGKPTWGSDTGNTNVREDATYRSDGKKNIIMHSDTRYLMQQLPDNQLKPSAYYLLTYDFWTSDGYNNGGVTYQILLGSERCADDIMHLTGHTTHEVGTAKSSYSVLFQIPEQLPAETWFALYRDVSKVDWIDNLNMMEIIPDRVGITGVTSAIYLAGYAYYPENITFPDDTYVDMTPCILNPDFDDGTMEKSAPVGWNLESIVVPQSKISVGEKGNGIIESAQNHWQLWMRNGGITGKIYQTISDLPNGKYVVCAAVSSSFSGNIDLYANYGNTKVVSEKHIYYEAGGTVFDGTLELGLDIETTGSPTIDFDHFTLRYCGMDLVGYLALLDMKIKEAIADTLEMQSNNAPGYNNLLQYRKTLDAVTQLPDSMATTLITAIAAIDNLMNEHKTVLAAYTPLKDAIDTLIVKLAYSEYPDKRIFNEAIYEAQRIYNNTVDQRVYIAFVINELAIKSTILDEYNRLKEAIVLANSMLVATDYIGKQKFEEAISRVQEAYNAPADKDLTIYITRLQLAKSDYYNSQYTKPSVKQIVSRVDTSLKGSEKFVLRVDGKPFYMTNIQVRLDKLYGYKGWTDHALEAVIKRAADDGFNTVSIPVHWREVEPEKDYFDWTILDKYMGWCKKYNLKMELLWFSWSSGGRVQYLVNNNNIKMPRTPDYVCSLEGKSEFNMLRDIWEYSLDWRDKQLRDREKYVMEQVMEHIAVWEANNEQPHTVIGVQLGNEARAHGANSATSAEIIDYYHVIGDAIKESNHVVWTRLNCVSYETGGRTSVNEDKRNNSGTNIDFVGIDVYGTNASSIKGDINGQLGAIGKNYRMIMEIDAKDSNSPIYQMAALAGDKAFNYYNMCVVDGNALYTNNDTTLVERSHITEVRQRNKILNRANQDIALKAHGNSLYVYNYAGNSTEVEKGIENILFKPSTLRSQAIAIRRSPYEIILLVTGSGAFIYPEALGVISASKGYFNENNEWIDEGTVSFTETSLTMPATSAVRLVLPAEEAEEVMNVIKNPSFDR